jgi:hypothetical protein
MSQKLEEWIVLSSCKRGRNLPSHNGLRDIVFGDVDATMAIDKSKMVTAEM